MMSLTIEQLQTNFDQAIDFVKTSKPLTITQDGQPMVMLLSSKKVQNCCACVMQCDQRATFATRLKNLPQGVSELSVDDKNKLVAELGP